MISFIQKGTYRTRRYQYTDTHIYEFMLTSPVVCTHELPILHSMNNLLIQKFTLWRTAMFLLLKHYWPVEVIYLLIRCSKTNSCMWNIKNTDRNSIMEKFWENSESPSYLVKFKKSIPQSPFYKGRGSPTMLAMLYKALSLLHPLLYYYHFLLCILSLPLFVLYCPALYSSSHYFFHYLL